MSPLSIQDVQASYSHVISGGTIDTVCRLLEIESGPWGRTSIVMSSADAPPTRRLLELEGLGSEIWTGLDVGKYIDELRSEWDVSK